MGECVVDGADNNTKSNIKKSCKNAMTLPSKVNGATQE